MTYVLIDIGGTKTRVATSVDLEKLDTTTSFQTINDFKEGTKLLTATIKAELGSQKVSGFAVGVRGLLNETKTGIENDAVLTEWAKHSIVALLEKHFHVPVLLENDTALAGLGEAWYGAGKEVDIMVYHTISTGVGGVKIEQGVIDMASAGFEPGHQVLDIDRTILGADITPTLENLVSGSGVEARFGMKPYEIPQSDTVWDELAEYLAQGLRNTILYWSPEMIVLGGSMIIGDPRIPLEAIRKYTVEVLDGFVPCPFITTAKLGDEAGLYGAMALLKQRQEGE